MDLKKIKFIVILLIFILLVANKIFAEENIEKKLNLITAIHQTIKKHPNIHLQKKQVEISQGILQSSRGQFDLKLQTTIGSSRDNTPLLLSARTNGYSELIQDHSFYNISLNKQFRSGFSVTSKIGLNRTQDAFSNQTVPNYAEVGLILKLPLLKGRGKAATGALETAYQINYESGALDLSYSISQQVFNTIAAYWNYVAAINRLNIQIESESRARTLVNDTDMLIKADERPEADIQQLEANLADKEASQIAAKQANFEAKHSLGLAMGLSFDDINSLALPADDFSLIQKIDLSKIKDTSYFIQVSIERRTDLLASLKRMESGKVLLNAAVNSEKTKLDLQFECGYSGLHEGKSYNNYFTPFNQNLSGLNLAGTLVLELPTKSGRGQTIQRNSEYEQQLIQIAEIERNIKTSVVTAVNSLKSSALWLEKSQKAIVLYKNTVENEKKKLQQGMSTLIDLVLFEDRLTGSLLNYVSAQLSYSIAVARLRYETGTLFEEIDDQIIINLENLRSIPFYGDY